VCVCVVAGTVEVGGYCWTVMHASAQSCAAFVLALIVVNWLHHSPWAAPRIGYDPAAFGCVTCAAMLLLSLSPF